MAITKVKVSNFKSFDELEVELRPLNIVVGANASGKSNFVEVFRFLRDLGTYGLENAVSIQGGMEYLTNLQIGRARPLVVELTYTDDEVPLSVPETYRLALSFNSSGLGFEVVEEVLLRGRGDEIIKTSRAKGSHFPEFPFGLAIFDLEPKLSKKAVPIAGKADLESDGSNLALTLRNLLQDDEKRSVLVALVQDLLPFVEDIRVDRFSDKHLSISLEERYSRGHFLPAAVLSDGTLQLTTLIFALYFDKSTVTIIEEPDRNVHPHLISRMADMLEDTSHEKQLILTTHSPELVKQANLSDLLLVHRDKQGFSRISRPAESGELKIFLSHDLGIDKLYVQNLLDVGYAV